MTAAHPAASGERAQPPSVRIRVPGRVNLIGDHTDYTGGVVLPMAIDRWTTIEGQPGGRRLQLSSDGEEVAADLPLDLDDPADVRPSWARYAAGVVQQVGATCGFRGHVSTTLPAGAGLSSSAALEIAVALALGYDGSALALAELCQRAEHVATGVPCGIMDQLAIAAAVPGHLTLIDCHEFTVDPVALPDDVDVVVVYGHGRTLDGSDYAERSRECAAVEAEIGPLRTATRDDALSLRDPTLRARARHVVTENERVRAFAAALAAHDVVAAGRLIGESHASLRDDFRTSTARMDALVDELAMRPGVLGARMTGGGFGGCVVALTRPGAIEEGWVARARGGPTVEAVGG